MRADHRPSKEAEQIEAFLAASKQAILSPSLTCAAKSSKRQGIPAEVFLLLSGNEGPFLWRHAFFSGLWTTV
jgi:hypothetical protein